ncbi:MAG: FtsW/RodA/SpoVE family cell cycle protein [Patescibacteria group bacterium]
MRLFEKYNFSLLISSVLICCISLLVLYSFNVNLVKQQLVFFFLGIILFFLVGAVDFTVLLIFSRQLFITIVCLLLLTFFVGKEIRGSVRWISFSFVNFQPSEFSKIILILVLSAFFGYKVKSSIGLKTFSQSLLLLLPILILVFIQPDLGTFLILLLVYISMFLYLKPSVYYFLFAFISGGILSNPIWFLLKDYQRVRIETFLNPSLDPQGSGYNVLQSTIAVGSGMLFGKGFGFGTQSRLRFLPEYHTDFIFASFAEEWGFVGVTVLLLLFLILLNSLVSSFKEGQTLEGRLVGIGVFSFVLFHVLINIGMNLGIMPVTGIPLPLMSYGGSSLISTFIALGLSNSVWYSSKRTRLG